MRRAPVAPDPSRIRIKPAPSVTHCYADFDESLGTAVDWMHSSGIALQMLADICNRRRDHHSLISNDSRRAQWVIRQYPRVLKCCDKLQFSDPAQALAYLILHLPDRYSRMFQVLERLLASAKLPLGRNPSFAAIDIGAGPVQVFWLSAVSMPH